MPAEVYLPYGGDVAWLQLKMWTPHDGSWQGTHSRSIIPWDGIEFRVDPGHENPNVPNYVYIVDMGPPHLPTIHSPLTYIRPWERWLWKPGTRPRISYRVQSEGCTGLYDRLSRLDGAPILFRPLLGWGWWEARNYGLYAYYITFDCFLFNRHP